MAVTAGIEALIDELGANPEAAIVAHAPLRAARATQRIAFCHPGEPVEPGARPEIFTSPRDRRTRGYIAGRFG
jgi:phosphate transport system ATP-binding protein